MLVFSKERLDKVKEAYASDDNPVQIIKTTKMTDVTDSSSNEATSEEKMKDVDDENREKIQQNLENSEELDFEIEESEG
jgi:hypothetical protein